MKFFVVRAGSLRIGDYRVIYVIDEHEKTITLVYHSELVEPKA